MVCSDVHACSRSTAAFALPIPPVSIPHLRYSFQEPYHEPAFCPSTMVEGCDSTILVPRLTLDWGTASPLQAWPGLGFPADFFSVRLEGFIRGPVDGEVSFRGTADDMLRFTVDGDVVMDTVSAGGNASTSILTAEVAMTNGTLYPVTLELVEEQDEASMSLLWSYEGDGAANSSPVEVPSSALYYTRHLEGSPVTISVFPGEVNATASSYAGGGLLGCVAMEECSFAVTARDGGGNTRFAAGSDQWEVTVVGVGDWAAEGRTGEFVTPADAPLSASSISSSADDWISRGNVACVTGESSCTSTQDLTGLVQRGDAIAIAGETHVVNPDVDETFDSASLPLASPFLGESGSHEVFEIGDNTGKYTVSYTPEVRGDYSVTVKKPAVWETQLVQTVAESTGEDLSGTFKLVYQDEPTDPIGFNAVGSDIASALGGLSILGDATITASVVSADCSAPEVACAWLVTFAGVYGDADLLEADADGLGGNAAGVVVVEEVQGQDAMDIGGSPVTVSVVPNEADAERSTAWGRGLYEATAGETASFIVQARDANLNNRLDSQNSSVFLAVAFAPDADPADVPPVYGTVALLGDGSYNVSYTPTHADSYVLAVLMSTVVETQMFSFVFNSDADASGRFTLKTADGSQETAPISYDATADMVASALSAVEGIGVVEVNREVTSVTSGAASWSYTVSFVSIVGDVQQFTVGSADLVGWSVSPSATTVAEGEAAHIKTDTASPASLLREIQVVRISSSSAFTAVSADDGFMLSFKGHTTAALSVEATAQDVEDALEELSTVGGVSVLRQDAAAGDTGYEYVIEFEPWGGYDLEHYLNYGDMPTIVIERSSSMPAGVDTAVHSGGVPSIDGVATQDGASPFAPVVSPGLVSSEASTPVDADGVADQAGLGSAYFEATTSFQIESRDSFGNRVFDGPLKEVQIIEIATDPFGGVLSGSFEVSFQGHSVGLEVGASLANVEAAIEGLSSVGAVTVSTASVLNSGVFGVTTGDVMAGSPYVTPSDDVNSVLEEGDWLRLCDATNGLVYAVTSVDALAPHTITLDAPYSGDTQTSCALFRYGTMGSDAISYQYIITFDSNVGDLPALTVDGSGLVASTGVATAEVCCDAQFSETTAVHVHT